MAHNESSPSSMLSTFNPIQLLEDLRMKGDPRTRDFPIAGNPAVVFALMMSYLYIVKYGPRWMKDRKPFNITNLVRIYNLLMVILNAKFLWLALNVTYFPGGKYSLLCQGISKDIDPEDFKLYRRGRWYLLVRYADYLDTVFFIMRKKFNQITHLHVIHHNLVVFNGWFWFLYAPEGQPALGLCMNAFVHVVMYAYYFLSTFGPGVRKYLWWKKYLTKLQIAQFIIFIVHMSIPLFIDCGFPRHLVPFAIGQVVLVLVLFLNFYYRTYGVLRKNAEESKQKTPDGGQNAGSSMDENEESSSACRRRAINTNAA
ncbi:very long chain fatty acid elongase AAEL008004-like [Ornithodoros turicata]|uniref:very long chain fatty acid elongase AAEL008004-like n=1 Tax=Ornithodoros turicata TaxID=34597 RepID=UPI00313A2569